MAAPYEPKKKPTLCGYNDGVECDEWKKNPAGCDKCGFNPTVAEIRKAAIRKGEQRFLRYTTRDINDFKGWR